MPQGPFRAGWRSVTPLPTFLTHIQDSPPYNKGAFRIEISFPPEYPFKPPKITFKTKIYHPNVDEKGQVCLPIISAENWKPATKTDQGTCSPLAPAHSSLPGARQESRGRAGPAGIHLLFSAGSRYSGAVDEVPHLGWAGWFGAVA